MTDLSIDKGAAFSPCRRWRYSLWRVWSPAERRLVVVGLNPSTADETQDDQTIRRCIGFARAWRYGGITMLNLFGYRATNPQDMLAAADPVGPGNRNAFDLEFGRDPRPLVLCAWGAHGSHLGQDETVLGWLVSAGIPPHCLGMTQHGHPRHPLYVRADTELQAYTPKQA